MSLTKAEFAAHVKSFRFRELFNEMGWNNDRTSQSIVVGTAVYNLVGVAEKQKFLILTCTPEGDGPLPDKSMRLRIEAKVTKLFQEHLIIFQDSSRREQVWQLAVRKAGSPAKISETRFALSQDPELLYQRASGLVFTLDEEDKVTIIDVTKRVGDNFQQNTERVTKKFYEGFKKEHAAFRSFIKGIGDQLNMDWYASLMLNRLMFCYFIQKKGFLDNNRNYLRDKLRACREVRGKNTFYSFYRDFLLTLFHQGLGEPSQPPAGPNGMAVDIGRVPYLNGGLFEVHVLEKQFQDIVIDDEAFERLFTFFDEYEWHLDVRDSATGKDINPDVIGFIFEKYINERAKMGAYYTKEDITDYIGKNCIIPWLFDEVRRTYSRAFAANGRLWQMVRDSGTDYIYDAVKYGVPEDGDLFADLPEDIRQGFAPELENKAVDGTGPWLWELRKPWNRPAPADIALPTETCRELIERRKRFAELRDRIASGQITQISDFITCNLNIRQFAQDVITATDDPDFIRHFYKALLAITVLDPTCGSGAFLFAALNILEPLYEACLQRMKSFLDDAPKGKHKFFEETLARVNAPEHPNLHYFIYKTIILRNLYGVDIMNEAVEIAKLRLFLKLVATVDADYRKPNLGLEPLPDVDFNIRTGNTLVGYATHKEIQNISGLFATPDLKKRILEQCDQVARAYSQFKDIQLEHGDNFEDFKQSKDELNNRLKVLNDDLDGILYREKYNGYSLEGKYYKDWLASHQPFHWFAEFYEIMDGKGGFDVVIGNPPYVELSNVKKMYQIIGYDLNKTGNLYSLCIERFTYLLNIISRLGVIVPISAVSTPRMHPLMKFISEKLTEVYYSNYSVRPGKLFVGVDMNLTIIIGCKSNSKKLLYTNKYNRWNEYERNFVFYLINYFKGEVSEFKKSVYKISGLIEYNIIKKTEQFHVMDYYKDYSNDSEKIFYHSGGRYFRKCVPEKLSVEYKELSLKKGCSSGAISLLSSSLYYFIWIVTSDCYHVIKNDIDSMNAPETIFRRKEIVDKAKMLIDSLWENSVKKLRLRADGSHKEEINFFVGKSKHIIDQIDSLLAQHYGFTHDELDFIINYDIKYRMGKELNSEEA